MSDLYAPPSKDENAVILAIKMPKDLRDKWKAHCSRHNLDMSEVLRRFMKSELEAQEQRDEEFRNKVEV